MTFLIILMVLGGLTLIFSGFEHQSLKAFLSAWLGGATKKNG